MFLKANLEVSIALVPLNEKPVGCWIIDENLRGQHKIMILTRSVQHVLLP